MDTEEARLAQVFETKKDKGGGGSTLLPVENVIIPGMYSTFFASEIYNSVTYRAFQILGRGGGEG